jgi:hypothetical protein
VVAQVDDLVGVPLIAEDQDWKEDEGNQHRGRAQAPGRQQDRARGAGGCQQHSRAGK